MLKEVLQKYDLLCEPGIYNFFGFGEVNLRKLTLKQADQLYKRGFPELKLKEEPIKKVQADEVKTEPAVPDEDQPPKVKKPRKTTRGSSKAKQ